MEYRVCSKCKEKKELKYFYFRKSRGTLNTQCKSCLYEFQKNRWVDRKLKIVELLGEKCCICGYNKNYSALELHHLNPNEKKLDWNKLRLCSWDKVVKEVKKCILICSNCHKEFHYPQNNKEFKKYNSKDNSTLNNDNIVELKSTGFCPICKKEVFGTKFCSQKCSSFYKRKVKRPSKKTLEKEIKEYSWCKLGRKYNVTDNAVRKWAKKYNLI